VAYRSILYTLMTSLQAVYPFNKFVGLYPYFWIVFLFIFLQHHLFPLTSQVIYVNIGTRLLVKVKQKFA